MSKPMYKLRYLPQFYTDLEDKVLYIAKKLCNPQAAENLLDEVEKAIRGRLPYAEAFEPYQSAKERRYPYYRIYIKNYTAYYVVIDDEGEEKIMEMRRFLYNGQNHAQYI